MKRRYLLYDLQNGCIHDWLTLGPAVTPVTTPPEAGENAFTYYAPCWWPRIMSRATSPDRRRNSKRSSASASPSTGKLSTARMIASLRRTLLWPSVATHGVGVYPLLLWRGQVGDAESDALLPGQCLAEWATCHVLRAPGRAGRPGSADI